MILKVQFRSSFKLTCFFWFIFGGIRTVKIDSIYKILTVIMDYFVTYRKFFIIFFLSMLSVKNPSYLP